MKTIDYGECKNCKYSHSKERCTRKDGECEPLLVTEHNILLGCTKGFEPKDSISSLGCSSCRKDEIIIFEPKVEYGDHAFRPPKYKEYYLMDSAMHQAGDDFDCDGLKYYIYMRRVEGSIKRTEDHRTR